LAVERGTRAPVSFAGGSITYFGIFWPRFEPQELQKTIFSLFYTVIGSSLQGYEFYSCVGVSYNERSVQNVRRTCAEHAI